MPKSEVKQTDQVVSWQNKNIYDINLGLQGLINTHWVFVYTVQSSNVRLGVTI